MKRILSLGTLAFAVACTGTARAQSYQVTGTTPGGGNVVVGSGSGLGAIISGDGILSAGGSDNLTFAPGSVALGSGSDTVTFTTSNNIVLNNGSVLSGSGFNAVTFVSSSALSGETVTNNGAITAGISPTVRFTSIGGNFGSNQTGGNAGAGINFVTGQGFSGILVVNNGSITGGGVNSINDSTYGGNFFNNNDTGGNAGDGIDVTSFLTGSGISLVIKGPVSGGSFGSITNAAVGENNNDSNDTGGNAGNGITMDGGALLTVSLSNQSVISGGSFGTITTSRVGSNNGNTDIGGDAANGIATTSFGTSGTFSFSNQGAVSGGGITNNGGAFAGNYATANIGGNATSGMAIAGNAILGFSLVNQGSISGGAIAANSGNIGGNYGTNDTGGNVSIGVSLTAFNTISGVTIANFGTISGGSISSNSSSIGSNHHNGIGGSVSDGVAITAGGAITGVSIFNAGTITGGSISNDVGTIGGQHGLAGGDVGSGISLLSGGGGSNLSVTNFGVIAGGNNSSGNTAGAGILANTGNLTVTNWGAVSAGAGASPFAINLGGANNTVNLNGHSSVNGPIIAPGASNNVLNLNFTGLSPAVQAALKANIIAQNPLSNWSGTFTVRGVTYTVDPMIINFNLASYQAQAATPNQAAIGAALDSAATNPAPGTPLFNLFNAIDTSGNVPGALEALSPQKYEIYGDLAIHNATTIVLDVDARLNNLRDGSESVDTTGVGGDNNTVALTSGYSKDGKDSKDKVVQPEVKENRWGFFATANGIQFRGNSNNIDLQEGKADSVGTVVGVDGKAGENAVVGVLFAYNNSDVTLGGDGSHATVDSYSGGLYGAWHQDGYYVNGLAAYTRNDYKSTRNIVLPGFFNSAAGSTSGNQASVNIDGGYDFHVTNRLTAGPAAGLQYVHMDVDSFNETGAGAAGLAIGSQSMDSLQSRLGGRIDYHLLAQPGVAFAADFHAAWQHEFLNDSRAIGGSFQAAALSPFSIRTAAPQRESAVVGLGLNVTFKNRITLYAGYDLQIWKASYLEQSVNGGAKVSW